MIGLRALLISFSLIAASLVVAQEPSALTCTDDITSVVDQVGKDVVFCGTPSGVKTITKEEASRVYLDFGGAYPNSTFSVVIWGSISGTEHALLEERFTGKELLVKGTVKLYKDKPQIVIQRMEDIQVK